MMWKEAKKTLYLGWPIVLGNLTQIILGIIDSAMVGAIHSSQLAAAAFVNNIITIPMVFAIGLTMAISPLVSSALGENDSDKPLRILFNALIIVGIVALALAGLIHLNIDLIYHMGQDKIVADLARPYLIWMVWGTVPMAFFLAMKQFTDGLGKTRLPMYLAVSSIPINVVANYAFIYGKWGAPRMELTGAGVGTLISRTFIMLAILALILKGKEFQPYRLHLRDQLQVRKDRLWDIIRIGVPSSLQFGMESLAFAVSGIMSGWLGYTQQAAHQIAISLAALSFMVPLGISAAGSIRIGFAFGRKDWMTARIIGRSTMLIALAYGVFMGIIFILFRWQLPQLFNDEADVLKYASGLLFLAAVFQISDASQAIGVGLLRGIQDVRIPTLFVGIAYWGIGIPVGYLLAFRLGLEVSGLWIGLVCGLSASAVLLSSRFLTLSSKRRLKKQAEIVA